MIGGN